MSKFRTNTGDWKNIVISIFIDKSENNILPKMKNDLQYCYFFYNSNREKEQGYATVYKETELLKLLQCEFSKLEAFVAQMEIAKDSYFGKVLSSIYKDTEMKKVPGT